MLRLSCQRAARYPHGTDTEASKILHPDFCLRERNKKDGSSVVIVEVQRCFFALLARFAKKQGAIESDLLPCQEATELSDSRLAGPWKLLKDQGHVVVFRRDMWDQLTNFRN